MSRIEQIISDIEDYIDSCSRYPLNKSKILVNKDEMDDLLSELRLRTPEEIKKYQKIINNKDAILNDAKQRADNLVAQANANANEMISEHEIMQQAYAQANDMMQQANNDAQNILDKAVSDANDIRMAAVQYTDDELANLEKILVNMMNNVTVKFENFMETLSSSLQIVQANRASLRPAEEEEAIAQVQKEEEMSDYEDYTVNLDDEDH